MAMQIYDAMTPIAEPTAIRYGFVSARTALLLDCFLEGQDIAGRAPDASAGALQLVDDLLKVQSFYNTKTNSVAPGGEALDAYSCALAIIVEQRSEFGIMEFEDFVRFISSLHTAVEALAGGKTMDLDRDDARRAHMFFSSFSRKMLAELSRPKEPQQALP